MNAKATPTSTAAFIAANTGPSGRGCSCARPEDCTGDGFCEKFEAAESGGMSAGRVCSHGIRWPWACTDCDR